MSTSLLALLLLGWCAMAAAHGLGIRPQPSVPRIINGTLATQNATRHQVSIRRRLNDGYFFGTGHICGGSLIDDNVVLTATHCFLDLDIYDGSVLPAQNFIVVMGNLDRYEKDNDTLIFDIKNITFKFQTPKFNVSTYEDDLALVWLNGSVPRNHATVSPINYTHQAPPAGTVCQVTGWGYTETGYLSDMLMTVDVPIIDFDVCANDTDFDEGMIKPGMVCAGYPEGLKDACNGDSGGPMVCTGLQAGIVSWGVGCALPNLPGVYTDVAYYAPWIDEQLGRDAAMAMRGASALLLGLAAMLIVFLPKLFTV